MLRARPIGGAKRRIDLTVHASFPDLTHPAMSGARHRREV
jgi:hypothetical protein